MAKVEIFLSKKRKHLIFATKFYVDGIEVRGKDKVGILSIENPDNAENILVKAKSVEWKLGDEKDEYGFSTVERII